MAATLLGSLLISLGLESGQFKSDLKDAEKQVRSYARRIEAVGSRMQNIGRNLALGVTLPLAAIGAAAFKAASDVQELESAFDATFGSMAASVRKWAVETGDAMGRSTQEIQASVIAYQELFSKAFDPAKAAEMSKQFAVLTQDLASFKNLSNDVAQQKLFSGLVGEAEPLRAVGVLLSDVAVKAKASELGLGGVKRELTEQEKITARAAIIMDQLSTAQGDVIRTSGSTANQIKAARAAFEELQVTIGTKLLPALTPLISGLASLLQAFGQLPEGVQTGILAFAGLAAAMGPVLFVIGGITRALGPMIAAVRVSAATATAAGVATSGFSAALALLRTRLLAALAVLGPYAAAAAALAGVIYLATRRTAEEEAAAKKYIAARQEATKAVESATTATDALATAHGKAREEALALARAERENIKQKLASARASVVLAQAELARAQAYRNAQNQASVGASTPGGGLFIQGTGDRKVAASNENLATAVATEKRLAASLEAINKALAAPAPTISVPSVGGDKDKKGKKGRKEASGRSAAEIERQFQDELAGYAQQTLSARQRMAMSADEAAELELRSVELARLRTIESVKADEDYSKAQKQRLIDAVENLAEFERAGIEFQKRMTLEQEAADLAQVRFDTERDLLQNQYDLADTQAERKRVALEILALEQRYQRSKLQAVIDSETAGDAEKLRARELLASLEAIQAGDRERVSRANETAGEQYAREINQTPAQINEAIEGIKIDGLKALNQGLTDAIMGFKSLGDVAKSILQQITAELLNMAIRALIIKPLAGALGIPGFAAGTNFAPGGVALVGERGPELVNLPRGSQVIPNHELSSMGGGGNVYKPTFVFPGVTNAAQAREAGAQAARRFRQGINGPVRT